MAGGGLMQLIAYGAMDVYLAAPISNKTVYKVRLANKFMYHGYLTPDYDAAFQGNRTTTSSSIFVNFLNSMFN